MFLNRIVTILMHLLYKFTINVYICTRVTAGCSYNVKINMLLIV